MNRFLSFALASATACSLALTPVPAAAADGEDVAAAIAGIAVLGLIAKAASDRRDDQRAAAASRLSRQTQPTFGNGRIIEGDILASRHQRSLNLFKQTKLPQRCAAQLRTGNGLHPVYGQRCLNQRYAHAASLPQQCERKVRTQNGLRTFFSRRCLARDGWNVAVR